MRMRNNLVSLCIGIFLSSLVLMAPVYGEIDPDSIAGTWLLDDGEGDTAKDISGLDNDGTHVGEPVWTDGNIDKALEFDGVDDYVSIADTEEMSGGPGKKITAMAWFNPSKTSGGQNPIVVKYLSAGEKDWGLLVGSSQLKFGYETGGNNFEVDSPLLGGVVTANTWYHGAFTLDGKDVRIYLDGEEVGEVTLPTDTPDSTAGVTIGGTPYRGDFFQGIIDEIAVFNTVLSEDDIEAIMENGIEDVIGGNISISSAGNLIATWCSIKVGD
jgi:hypothetical protein